MDLAMALPSAGYSSRPLQAKLGLKPGMRAAFVALPDQLSQISSSVDFESLEIAGRWAELSTDQGRYDVIHAFTTRRAEIEDHLSSLQDAIKRDGMIWVSWPKKASKMLTDVTEDVVRAEALKLDLVDVKVAAIDETWSGLKLVIRKDRR